VVGVSAPKNTPAEIVDKLNVAINSAIADPKLKARFTDLGGKCSRAHGRRMCAGRTVALVCHRGECPE
jgi:tripartite-type tricarboxylate transporter receptor subunit TctC